MRFNDYYIHYVNDCGENTGGYYCMVYSDEFMENEIDTFCVYAEDLKANPDVEYWIRKYLTP